MSKPIIAIDVDDVLSASAAAFVDFSNERWGTRLTIEDVDEDWAKMWQIDIPAMEARAAEFHQSGVVSSYHKYDEALPVLERLKNNYDLVVATSRNRRIDIETRDWLNENYPNIFKEIHFSGIFDGDTTDNSVCKLTKTDLLLKIGASYIIDDQPKHCFGAADVNLRAILFGDYPWNRDVDLPPGVLRCANGRERGVYFDSLIS